jgi:hypothetical protein
VGYRSAGSPKGPALSQADAPSTVPADGSGDAPERRRAPQVWRWRAQALSQWGENLGGAARLLESSQACRCGTPRRARAVAARKREGRSEAHGGMAAVSGRCDGRPGSLREGEAQEGSGLLRQANSRQEVPDSGYGKPRGRARGRAADSARPSPPRSVQPAGSQRRGGHGPRERHRRTWRSKPLKGEAQERSGMKQGREGSRGGNRREGRNPGAGT